MAASPTGGAGGPGVRQKILSRDPERGDVTRLLRFDAGVETTETITHDFWEEIYIVSGVLECGGRAYPAGSVAVRPPGMPHGPFHSAAGCVSFEVRYRTR